MAMKVVTTTLQTAAETKQTVISVCVMRGSTVPRVLVSLSPDVTTVHPVLPGRQLKL